MERNNNMAVPVKFDSHQEPSNHKTFMEKGKSISISKFLKRRTCVALFGALTIALIHQIIVAEGKVLLEEQIKIKPHINYHNPIKHADYAGDHFKLVQNEKERMQRDLLLELERENINPSMVESLGGVNIRNHFDKPLPADVARAKFVTGLSHMQLQGMISTRMFQSVLYSINRGLRLSASYIHSNRFIAEMLTTKLMNKMWMGPKSSLQYLAEKLDDTLISFEHTLASYTGKGADEKRTKLESEIRVRVAKLLVSKANMDKGLIAQANTTYRDDINELIQLFIEKQSVRFWDGVSAMNSNPIFTPLNVFWVSFEEAIGGVSGLVKGEIQNTCASTGRPFSSTMVIENFLPGGMVGRLTVPAYKGFLLYYHPYLYHSKSVPSFLLSMVCHSGISKMIRGIWRSGRRLKESILRRYTMAIANFKVNRKSMFQQKTEKAYYKYVLSGFERYASVSLLLRLWQLQHIPIDKYIRGDRSEISPVVQTEAFSAQMGIGIFDFAAGAAHAMKRYSNYGRTTGAMQEYTEYMKKSAALLKKKHDSSWKFQQLLLQVEMNQMANMRQEDEAMHKLITSKPYKQVKLADNIPDEDIRLMEEHYGGIESLGLTSETKTTGARECKRYLLHSLFNQDAPFLPEGENPEKSWDTNRASQCYSGLVTDKYMYDAMFDVMRHDTKGIQEFVGNLMSSIYSIFQLDIDQSYYGKNIPESTSPTATERYSLYTQEFLESIRTSAMFRDPYFKQQAGKITSGLINITSGLLRIPREVWPQVNSNKQLSKMIGDGFTKSVQKGLANTAHWMKRLTFQMGKLSRTVAGMRDIGILYMADGISEIQRGMKLLDESTRGIYKHFVSAAMRRNDLEHPFPVCQSKDTNHILFDRNNIGGGDKSKEPFVACVDKKRGLEAISELPFRFLVDTILGVLARNDYAWAVPSGIEVKATEMITGMHSIPALQSVLKKGLELENTYNLVKAIFAIGLAVRDRYFNIHTDEKHISDDSRREISGSTTDSSSDSGSTTDSSSDSEEETFGTKVPAVDTTSTTGGRTDDQGTTTGSPGSQQFLQVPTETKAGRWLEAINTLNTGNFSTVGKNVVDYNPNEIMTEMNGILDRAMQSISQSNHNEEIKKWVGYVLHGLLGTDSGNIETKLVASIRFREIPDESESPNGDRFKSTFDALKVWMEYFAVKDRDKYFEINPIVEMEAAGIRNGLKNRTEFSSARIIRFNKVAADAVSEVENRLLQARNTDEEHFTTATQEEISETTELPMKSTDNGVDEVDSGQLPGTPDKSMGITPGQESQSSIEIGSTVEPMGAMIQLRQNSSIVLHSEEIDYGLDGPNRLYKNKMQMNPSFFMIKTDLYGSEQSNETILRLNDWKSRSVNVKILGQEQAVELIERELTLKGSVDRRLEWKPFDQHSTKGYLTLYSSDMINKWRSWPALERHEKLSDMLYNHKQHNLTLEYILRVMKDKKFQFAPAMNSDTFMTAIENSDRARDNILQYNQELKSNENKLSEITYDVHIKAMALQEQRLSQDDILNHPEVKKLLDDGEIIKNKQAKVFDELNQNLEIIGRARALLSDNADLLGHNYQSECIGNIFEQMEEDTKIEVVGEIQAVQTSGDEDDKGIADIISQSLHSSGVCTYFDAIKLGKVFVTTRTMMRDKYKKGGIADFIFDVHPGDIWTVGHTLYPPDDAHKIPIMAKATKVKDGWIPRTFDFSFNTVKTIITSSLTNTYLRYPFEPGEFQPIVSFAVLASILSAVDEVSYGRTHMMHLWQKQVMRNYVDRIWDLDAGRRCWPLGLAETEQGLHSIKPLDDYERAMFCAFVDLFSYKEYDETTRRWYPKQSHSHDDNIIGSAIYKKLFTWILHLRKLKGEKNWLSFLNISLWMLADETRIEGMYLMKQIREVLRNTKLVLSAVGRKFKVEFGRSLLGFRMVNVLRPDVFHTLLVSGPAGHLMQKIEMESAKVANYRENPMRGPLSIISRMKGNAAVKRCGQYQKAILEMANDYSTKYSIDLREPDTYGTYFFFSDEEMSRCFTVHNAILSRTVDSGMLTSSKRISQNLMGIRAIPLQDEKVKSIVDKIFIWFEHYPDIDKGFLIQCAGYVRSIGPRSLSRFMNSFVEFVLKRRLLESPKWYQSDSIRLVVYDYLSKQPNPVEIASSLYIVFDRIYQLLNLVHDNQGDDQAVFLKRIGIPESVGVLCIETRIPNRIGLLTNKKTVIGWPELAEHLKKRDIQVKENEGNKDKEELDNITSRMKNEQQKAALKAVFQILVDLDVDLTNFMHSDWMKRLVLTHMKVSEPNVLISAQDMELEGSGRDYSIPSLDDILLRTVIENDYPGALLEKKGEFYYNFRKEDRNWQVLEQGRVTSIQNIPLSTAFTIIGASPYCHLMPGKLFTYLRLSSEFIQTPSSISVLEQEQIVADEGQSRKVVRPKVDMSRFERFVYIFETIDNVVQSDAFVSGNVLPDEYQKMMNGIAKGSSGRSDTEQEAFGAEEPSESSSEGLQNSAVDEIQSDKHDTEPSTGVKDTVGISELELHNPEVEMVTGDSEMLFNMEKGSMSFESFESAAVKMSYDIPKGKVNIIGKGNNINTQNKISFMETEPKEESFNRMGPYGAQFLSDLVNHVSHIHRTVEELNVDTRKVYQKINKERINMEKSNRFKFIPNASGFDYNSYLKSKHNLFKFHNMMNDLKSLDLNAMIRGAGQESLLEVNPKSVDEYRFSALEGPPVTNQNNTSAATPTGDDTTTSTAATLVSATIPTPAATPLPVTVPATATNPAAQTSNEKDAEIDQASTSDESEDDVNEISKQLNGTNSSDSDSIDLKENDEQEALINLVLQMVFQQRAENDELPSLPNDNKLKKLMLTLPAGEIVPGALFSTVTHFKNIEKDGIGEENTANAVIMTLLAKTATEYAKRSYNKKQKNYLRTPFNEARDKGFKGMGSSVWLTALGNYGRLIMWQGLSGFNFDGGAEAIITTAHEFEKVIQAGECFAYHLARSYWMHECHGNCKSMNMWPFGNETISDLKVLMEHIHSWSWNEYKLRCGDHVPDKPESFFSPKLMLPDVTGRELESELMKDIRDHVEKFGKLSNRGEVYDNPFTTYTSTTRGYGWNALAIWIEMLGAYGSIYHKAARRLSRLFGNIRYSGSKLNRWWRSNSLMSIVEAGGSTIIGSIGSILGLRRGKHQLQVYNYF